MAVSIALQEFRTRWLPHTTVGGLARVAKLLEDASPLLIYGAFSRCASQGCLATHLAWHHPATERHQFDAGVVWLTKVARMNPATSALLLEWDRAGWHNWELREELLAECRDELRRRAEKQTEAADHVELCEV